MKAMILAAGYPEYLGDGTDYGLSIAYSDEGQPLEPEE